MYSQSGMALSFDWTCPKLIKLPLRSVRLVLIDITSWEKQFCLNLHAPAHKATNYTCNNPVSIPKSMSNLVSPISSLVLPDLYLTILPNRPSSNCLTVQKLPVCCWKKLNNYVGWNYTTHWNLHYLWLQPFQLQRFLLVLSLVHDLVMYPAAKTYKIIH